MIFQVEPGAEKYSSWAARKARVVASARVALGVPALSKFYVPEPGFMVWVKATEAGTIVRVTGGRATGRKHVHSLTDGVTVTNVDRFYVLDKGKLKKYAELPYVSLGDISVLSLDGSTMASALGYPTATATVSRNMLAPATDTYIGINGAPSLGAGRGDGVNYLMLREFLGFSMGNGDHAALSENGKILAIRESHSTANTNQLTARIYDVGVNDPKTPTTTTLTLQTSGLPQWVRDFYASLPIPHALYSDPVVTGGSLYAVATPPGLTVFNDGFTSITASLYDPLDVSLTPPANGFMRIRSLQPLITVLYDRYTDRCLMFAQLPYYSAWAAVYDPNAHYTVSVGEHLELRSWNTATKVWEKIYAEDLPDVADFVHDSTAGSGTLGSGSTSIMANDKTNMLPGTTAAPFQPAVGSARSLGPLITGVYGNSSPYSVRRNGVSIGTVTVPSSSATIAAAGAVVGTGDALYWVGAWGTVAIPTVSATNFQLAAPSPALDELLFENSSTLAWQYWRAGALAQSFTAPPTPDSTSFVSYGTPSPAGFYFIGDFASGGFAWHFGKKLFKCKVYTSIKFTPGSGGGAHVFMHLFGGTAHVPGIGDFPVNQAGGDGFNAGATLLYVSNNDGTAGSFSPADFDAGFGTSGTTFTLDGTSYDLDLGAPAGTPDTYAWNTATVDIGWDVTLGALKVFSTYSTATQTVPSRGSLTETISGVSSTSFSDATLAQDYLSPTKAGTSK